MMSSDGSGASAGETYIAHYAGKPRLEENKMTLIDFVSLVEAKQRVRSACAMDLTSRAGHVALTADAGKLEELAGHLVPGAPSSCR